MRTVSTEGAENRCLSFSPVLGARSVVIAAPAQPFSASVAAFENSANAPRAATAANASCVSPGRSGTRTASGTEMRTACGIEATTAASATDNAGICASVSDNRAARAVVIPSPSCSCPTSVGVATSDLSRRETCQSPRMTTCRALSPPSHRVSFAPPMLVSAFPRYIVDVARSTGSSASTAVSAASVPHSSGPQSSSWKTYKPVSPGPFYRGFACAVPVPAGAMPLSVATASSADASMAPVVAATIGAGAPPPSPGMGARRAVSPIRAEVPYLPPCSVLGGSSGTTGMTPTRSPITSCVAPEASPQGSVSSRTSQSLLSSTCLGVTSLTTETLHQSSPSSRASQVLLPTACLSSVGKRSSQALATPQVVALAAPPPLPSSSSASCALPQSAAPPVMPSTGVGVQRGMSSPVMLSSRLSSAVRALSSSSTLIRQSSANISAGGSRPRSSTLCKSRSYEPGGYGYGCDIIMAEPTAELDKVHLCVQAFLQTHLAIAQAHRVERLKPGVYAVDGNEVHIEWHRAQEPGQPGVLIVVDGPMRQPLPDYLSNTEANAQYATDAVEKTSALHRIPKERRMTFDDKNAQYTRLEAMRVAKEQANLREKAAGYIRDGREVPEELVDRYNKALRRKVRSGRSRQARSHTGHEDLDDGSATSDAAAELENGKKAAASHRKVQARQGGRGRRPKAGNDENRDPMVKAASHDKVASEALYSSVNSGRAACGKGGADAAVLAEATKLRLPTPRSDQVLREPRVPSVEAQPLALRCQQGSLRNPGCNASSYIPTACVRPAATALIPRSWSSSNTQASFTPSLSMVPLPAAKTVPAVVFGPGIVPMSRAATRTLTTTSSEGSGAAQREPQILTGNGGNSQPVSTAVAIATPQGSVRQSLSSGSFRPPPVAVLVCDGDRS